MDIIQKSDLQCNKPHSNLHKIFTNSTIQKKMMEFKNNKNIFNKNEGRCMDVKKHANKVGRLT